MRLIHLDVNQVNYFLDWNVCKMIMGIMLDLNAILLKIIVYYGITNAIGIIINVVK